MIYRLILSEWAREESPAYPNVIEEQDLTDSELADLNQSGYNCYFLPNTSSTFTKGKPVAGSDIDQFMFAFVDMDLKHEGHESKDAFVQKLLSFSLEPSSIIDSGNGIHAYWRIVDLDAKSFLRIQRRLTRHFDTDPAVAKIYQLMRVPGTLNVKKKDALKPCEVLHGSGKEYTCEDLDKALPKITMADEAYCEDHYRKTFEMKDADFEASAEIPLKFHKLLKSSDEIKHLFMGKDLKDRSQADFRLGHLLIAEGFTKEEARAVLMNTQKASERSPVHRYNYADNIVQKIWSGVKDELDDCLIRSVGEIMADGGNLDGIRIKCDKHFDDTKKGFRLTQVLGLIGGAGSGKTAISLNMFGGFVKKNPEFIHVAVPLEQPENELAQRWLKYSGGNPALFGSVYILGNYNADGSYRNLSLDDIEEYVLKLEKKTGKKVGCVMIDHIGVLKKKTKDGENQGLIDICHKMKAFAVATNTFVIMQSQAPRAKASIGDIELDKDAAYGTMFFEAYCDFVVTTWQPLKRIYDEADHMTVTCFKYCKIRHKDVKADRIKEDVIFAMLFEPETETLREMTEDEKKQFDFWNKKATNLRNKDRKREPAPIKFYEQKVDDDNGTETRTGSNKKSGRPRTLTRVS